MMLSGRAEAELHLAKRSGPGGSLIFIIPEVVLSL